MATIVTRAGKGSALSHNEVDANFTNLNSDKLEANSNITVADATVTGDLTVQGTTTTLNTATLQVEDKNITLNYSTGDSSGSADGAGITIQDAVSSSTDATILWDATNDTFDFSHAIQVQGLVDIASGEIGLKNSGSVSNIKFYCEVGNAHYTALQSSPHSAYSGNVTLTLPPATDTLVGRATTDTLTNKTLTSPTINGGTHTSFASTGIDDNGTSTAITVDSSQNVGIGTTSPSTFSNASELVVDTGTAGGITVVSDSTSGGYGALYFADGTTGDEQYRGFFQYNHNNSGTDEMLIGTAGTTRMTVSSSGNVGIGGSPSGILHLKSDDNGMIFQSSSSSNSRAQIFFQNTGGTTTGKIAVDPDGGNANVMAFSTGSTERFRVDSAGRVLIGTTTEGQGSADDLTIATSGNTGITIRSGTSNEGAIYFSDGTSGVAEYEGMIAYDHATNSYRIIANHAEVVRIASDGDVGIATSSPAQKLDVNGAAVFGSGTTRLTTYSDSTYSGFFNGSSIASDESIYMGADTIYFYGGGAEIARIDSTGIVGVGINSYLSGIAASGDIYVGVNSESYVRFQGSTGTKYARFYLESDEDVRFTEGGHGYFNGDVIAYSTTIASDARFKDNVKPLEGCLDKVCQMRGVSYTWNEQSQKEGVEDIGVIAQEMAQIYPEVVTEVDGLNGRDPHLTVDYARLTAVLINAVKELRQEVEELKNGAPI